MTVLGVDPALNRLGWAVVAELPCLKVVAHGCISPARTLSFPEKLRALHAGLEEIVHARRPDVIAIEEIYVGRNVRVALKIGQVIGMVMALGLRTGVPFETLAPRDVKKTIVGTGSAEKGQVRFMVEYLTKAAGLSTLDESDAVAVALAYLTARKVDDLLRRGNAC